MTDPTVRRRRRQRMCVPDDMAVGQIHLAKIWPGGESRGGKAGGAVRRARPKVKNKSTQGWTDTLRFADKFVVPGTPKVCPLNADNQSPETEKSRPQKDEKHSLEWRKTVLGTMRSSPGTTKISPRTSKTSPRNSQEKP